jgi:hypothetical protein
MKIGIFIPHLCGGGAERMMVNLSNGLAEAGIDVDLIVADYKGVYVKEVSSKVNVVNLKKKNII